MKFCSVCENMMYIQVEDPSSKTPKLLYYCKMCNNSQIDDVQGGMDSILVHERNFVDDSSTYKSFMTPDIKYDPTLPRVSNIACPNTQCTKTKEQHNEVIYIKYDHENMKYLYFCCHCNHFWKFD
jgi:DNA-directed RNA polymerase subunit M/transcription elongation factor TFIIS